MAATSSAWSWSSLVSGWLSCSSVAGSLWTGGGVAVGVAVGGSRGSGLVLLRLVPVEMEVYKHTNY